MRARRRKRKIKNAVLKTLVVLGIVAFMVSACMVDTDSWVPPIVCNISALWLLAFAYANGYVR